MGRGFWGRGGGRGGGRGRGWRHWYYATGLPGWARAGWAPAGGPAAYGAYPPYAAAPYAPAVPANVELDALKSQAEYLRGTLEEIQKRMAELEAEAAKKE
jgi:hypothetical protein